MWFHFIQLTRSISGRQRHQPLSRSSLTFDVDGRDFMNSICTLQIKTSEVSRTEVLQFVSDMILICFRYDFLVFAVPTETTSGWWWLEPWNSMTVHSVGNFIIPTDELHHVSKGLKPPIRHWNVGVFTFPWLMKSIPSISWLASSITRPWPLYNKCYHLARTFPWKLQCE